MDLPEYVNIIELIVAVLFLVGMGQYFSETALRIVGVLLLVDFAMDIAGS